jgi:hypothetical protein
VYCGGGGGFGCAAFELGAQDLRGGVDYVYTCGGLRMFWISG